MSYPHKRFYTNDTSPEAATAFETRQLDNAINYFKHAVTGFNAATGFCAALPDEEKESLLPYLADLVECGLPQSRAEDIIYASPFAAKSIDRADAAFRGIANFVQDTGIKHADRFHIALHYLSKSLRTVAAEAKYSPSQPRVPRGNSRGGQWTDSGGGGGRSTTGRTTPPLPQRKPPVPARNPPHPHADSPYYDPATGIYDPPIQPVGNPVTDAMIIVGGARILKPAADAVVGGVTAARNAVRLRGYLAEARQIPKGVKEVSKGTEHLTTGQRESLKEFSRSRSKYKKDIKVLNYSDGRAIYSVKQPAKHIPDSYTVWEQQVSADGKMIRLNKTTVGPDGELIHIKVYNKN